MSSHLLLALANRASCRQKASWRYWFGIEPLPNGRGSVREYLKWIAYLWIDANNYYVHRLKGRWDRDWKSAGAAEAASSPRGNGTESEAIRREPTEGGGFGPRSWN